MGALCGGMTSTPALGSLIQVAGTDDVASAYASTYPIALVTVVLVEQMIVLLFLKKCQACFFMPGKIVFKWSYQESNISLTM